MCGPGGSGKLCDVCKAPSYYNDEGQCELCSGNLLLLYVFMGIFAALVGVSLLVWNKFGAYISANYPLIIAAIFDTGRLKVIFASGQIMGSVAWSTGVHWPPPFSYLAKVYSIFELNIFDILPVECASPNFNFYGSMVTQTLTPLCVNAALFLVMQGEIKAHNPRGWPIAPTQQANRRRAGRGVWCCCLKYLGDENFIWMLILLIFYVFLPTANLACIRTFKCTQFPDGSSWLNADLSIQCTTSSGRPLAVHVLMITYASLMLAVYGPGVPLLYFVLLQKNRKAIQNYDKEADFEECPRELKPLKFLFFHYEPERYNAEVWECLRRMLMIGGVAALPTKQKSDSALLGVLLSVAFAIDQRERSPWHEPSTNALAFVTFWCVGFVFLGAYVILVGQEDTLLSPVVVSTLLLLISILVIGRAVQQQAVEFRKNRELLLLKSQIADFREQVVGIAFVKRTLRAFERQRFLGGDWSMKVEDMPAEMKEDLARQTSVDVEHLRDETWMNNFIEIQQRFDEAGEVIDWYWQEEASRAANWADDVKHPDAGLLANQNRIWVKYSSAVTAQLEKRYLELQEQSSKEAVEEVRDAAGIIDPLIAVDLEGKVVGAGSDSTGNNGLRYQVDCQRMIQINARTGYERPCLRVATKVEKNRLFGGGQESKQQQEQSKHNNDLKDINSFTSRDGPGTAITLNADKLDARTIEESDIPPFPFDLIEAEEPLLLIQKGQLIQIQKKRDDGWMYGFVVWEPEELAESNKDDRLSKRAVLKKNAASSEASGTGEGTELSALQGLIEEQPPQWVNKNDKEHELGGESAGWFPSIFVRPPAMKELKEMQDFLGGSEAAQDALAVPDTWSDDSKAGKTTNVKFVAIPQKSTEWSAVEDPFIASMDGRRIRIKSIDRIENLGLWQSYAAKKNSMFLRAKNEGADSSKYEKPMMYHGTAPEVIPKIAQQGFNRAYCGKNAVRYGKGVYFALTSSYSNAYAGQNPKRMFVCRVLAGETSQGHNEQLVPEVRVAATNVMFDSTTDRVECPEPVDTGNPAARSSVRQMYVVYHDAQAYPEYLIEVKKVSCVNCPFLYDYFLRK